jgi:hypothetical protein
MANLMDFVKDKDFSTDSEADPFPEGKTKLEVAEIEVQEHEVEFDGKKRMRYILKAGDKQYWLETKSCREYRQRLRQALKRLK